eukprot:64781-Chlamydomonas_euryale.AAC.6
MGSDAYPGVHGLIRQGRRAVWCPNARMPAVLMPHVPGCMAVRGSAWRCLGVPGGVWPCLADGAWQCLAVSGNAWLMVPGGVGRCLRVRGCLGRDV